MYSTMAVTAAIAIIALAVNVIDTTPTPPSVEAGSTHVVAADGTGDFSTIAGAVTSAAEGDTVLVRPGSYVEAIVIDKDITLAGDGPREDIVISAPDDAPVFAFAETGGIQQYNAHYVLLIDDTEAEVRGLTFDGDAVIVDGGSPTLSDLVLVGNELLIQAGSTATFMDSLMIDGGGIETAGRSEPLIAGNVLRGGPSIVGSMGDGAIIRDNTLTDTLNGIGLGGMRGDEPSSALIEGNTITGTGGYAINAPSHGTSAPVIRDNTISGSRNGIQISGAGGATSTPDSGSPNGAAARPLVTGNEISAEMIAISIAWSDANVVDNTIREAWNGIVLFGSGSPEIMRNEVDVDGFGLDIGANTSPSVEGNDVCGGSASINIHESATPSLGDNTTCDPA